LFCLSIIVVQLSQKHGDGYVFEKKYLSRRDLQQTGCTSWWDCVYLNTRNG
jgi:hypothetical protein